MRYRWGLAAAIVVALVPAAAGADSGVFFGGSIGRGQLDIGVDCASCDGLGSLNEALSVSAHAGFKLDSHLGIAADFWMVRFQERDNLRFADSSDHLIIEQVALASAQLWLSRLWLRPGVGVAWHQTDLEYPVDGRAIERTSSTPIMTTTDASGIAPAAGVAIGLELARTQGFALELALRGAAASHDGDVRVNVGAITIGGTWY